MNRPPADLLDHLITRLQSLPGPAFGLGRGFDPGTELLADPAVGIGNHLGEHRLHDVKGIENAAAVATRVEVALAGSHLDLHHHAAAQPDDNRGSQLVSRPGIEDERAVGPALVRGEPAAHSLAGGLLLTLDQHAHVHRQCPGAGELAGNMEQRQEVALVIRRAASVDPAIAHVRLEGWRGPGGLVAHGLHVVVAVDEDGWRFVVPAAEFADRKRVATVLGAALRGSAGGDHALTDPIRRRIH